MGSYFALVVHPPVISYLLLLCIYTCTVM
uniref:Uncharacterized protein n=1 Tax=Anguilla anguilla TaxID=7936 RepID=A0A0E9X9J0_ANGAN